MKSLQAFGASYALTCINVRPDGGGGGGQVWVGHFTFQCQFLVKIPTLGPEKWVKSDKMHPTWANNIPNYYMARNSQAKWSTVISW